MQGNIGLPAEGYNTIYIFICFLVFFWLFKAARRYYRVIQLRSAVLSDSLVQIQGLASYLSYFDGAINTHLHAIVHTRQTKPPVEMSMVLVPCSLLKAVIRLEAPGDRSTLELQFNAAVPGKLVSMLNFNMMKFRSAVSSAFHHSTSRRSDLTGLTNRRGSGGVGLTNFISDGTSSPYSPPPSATVGGGIHSLFSIEQQQQRDGRKYFYLSYLSEMEVCDRVCVKHDCVVGSQTIQLSFMNPQSVSGNNDIFTIAIAFLPSSSALAEHHPKVKTPNSEGILI
jgi:hypothetical protein